MKKESRFVLRSRDGDQQIWFGSPESVLSLALTRALASDKPGVWSVLEWGSAVYRVVKPDDPKDNLLVSIETV